MYGENHERIARDVAEDTLGNADGDDVRLFVGENESAYEARDAEEGTRDKNAEVFPEVVVHDAEIRIWNFECGVEDECRNGAGYHKAPRDTFFSFPAQRVANGFLA